MACQLPPRTTHQHILETSIILQNNTMSSEYENFTVPFVTMAKSTDPIDAGYELCNIGKVSIDKRTGIMLISDFEDGKLKLGVHLKKTRIKFMKFISGNRNHRGGRIEFHGFFGKAFQERLALQMELDEYPVIKSAVKAALSG